MLVARCIAHGQGVTFLPLLGALRRAEPELALAGEPDADLVLTRLAALAEGAQAAPLGESYWAVRRLLEALARTQPVLLVLDDVHWAEPALVDLVDYLADRTDAPLLVLCLARPELERTLGEPLELGPLGDEEARAIVAGTAVVDEATRERIVELAEGNALYAEQLASFAAEGGEGLPPTLEAVLAGRLGRLDPAERSVLQRAAVVGREFSLGAVAALADGEVAPELLSLSRAGFVHPAAAADPGDDGYTFHHVLLRDAAYASLTKADRADLHERAAAWIDRDGPGDDAIAGYHLEQAVRYRRELGEDADELAAVAGERLGEAGMRAWRLTTSAASVFSAVPSAAPAHGRRAELRWELAIALELRRGPTKQKQPWREPRRKPRCSGSSVGGTRIGRESTDVAVGGRPVAAEAAAASRRRSTRSKSRTTWTRSRPAQHGAVHLFACNLAEIEGAATQRGSALCGCGNDSRGVRRTSARGAVLRRDPGRRGGARCVALLEEAGIVRPRRMSSPCWARLRALRVRRTRGGNDDRRAAVRGPGQSPARDRVLAPLEMDAETATVI